MKVYEGSILTCDMQDHVYKYLVADDGRIAYVGDELLASMQVVPELNSGIGP